MRHRVAGRRLGRDSAHRKALRKNLMKALFEHGRIRTTKAKALSVRGDAERLVTLAKRGNAKREADQQDLHERRRVASELGDKRLTKKLFDEIAPQYAERPGGYTRVLDLGPRHGDRAEMVILELV